MTSEIFPTYLVYLNQIKGFFSTGVKRDEGFHYDGGTAKLSNPILLEAARKNMALGDKDPKRLVYAIEEYAPPKINQDTLDLSEERGGIDLVVCTYPGCGSLVAESEFQEHRASHGREKSSSSHNAKSRLKARV